MKRILLLILALFAVQALAIDVPAAKNLTSGKSCIYSGTTAGLCVTAAGYRGNTPLQWAANGWNPADLTSTTASYWSSGTLSLAPAWETSVSGPTSGVVTVTFNTPGYYSSNVCIQHRHSNSYTNMQQFCTEAGTASVSGSDGITNFRSGGLMNSADGTVCHSDVINVTASGQTYTVSCYGYVSSAGGTTSGHTFYGGFTIQPM